MAEAGGGDGLVRSVACVLGASAVAAACGAAPLHASADWERGVDLRPTKTFSIARSPWIPKELTPEQASLLSIVETTAKRELVEKGYQEAPPGQARLIATTYFIKRKRADVIDASVYCGAYDVQVTGGTFVPPGLVGSCEESYISKHDEGTLLIDMYDTELDELVWHGWASAEIPEPGSWLTPQLVERATIDILAKFPP